MLTIELTPLDLTKIRFGYSPLLELGCSYRLLHKPEMYGHYRHWVDEAKQALADVELPYLQALAGRYVPDFMTPTPLTTMRDIEAEFAQMRQVDAETIRRDIQLLIDLHGEDEMLLQFMAYPYEMLECLIEDMRLYWSRVLAHHWPRITSALEGDLLYRGRQLALEGTVALLNDISPEVQFENNCLLHAALHKPPIFHKHHRLEGQGLQVVPSMFIRSFMWQVNPAWQPMVSYRPRGTGLWYEPPKDQNEAALEIALGAGRARVLQALATPLTTGEIAHRLEITAGAASQHLSRLSDAGLTEAHRSGKRVFYRLTRRGEQLLQLFS